MTERHYFLRTFRYLKPYRATYAIGTFFYCIQQFAFPLLGSIFLGGVTAAILALSLSAVLDAIWLMAAMYLVFAALIGFGAYLYVVACAYATRDLSIDVFKAFMKSGFENQKHSGEGIAVLNTDVDNATNIFSDAFTPFLENVIGASFSAAAIFVIDWRLGLGALVIGLLSFFVQSRFARPLAKLGKARLLVNADAVKALSDIFAGALTIRAYNRQEHSLGRFRDESRRLRTLAYKQAFIGMWQDLFTTVQGWLTVVIVFALGGWLVIRGEIGFALIMAAFPLAGAISQAMSQIGTAYAGLQPPLVAAKRIFAIMDSAPDAACPLPEAHAEWDGSYHIRVDGLCFAYQDAGGKALENIHLSLSENKMIAVVGASGSGKSTLLRVITGMYARNGLKMRLGNLDFTAGNGEEWRRHFAYVDQSCQLFDVSIAENIVMGLQGITDDGQMREAAKRALADEFIAGLPDGYLTACGEKGAALSGGQKQRLVIARALYRKASVLVFDEATSALDAESERGIMETINGLRRDHTILITTHNLNNIITSDMIVVMAGGRIVEAGTHEELMAKGGAYKGLMDERPF